MKQKPTLKRLLWVLLKIGSIGFGGGPGMLALLKHEMVEKRGWVTEDDLSVGVGLGQMLPGPFVPNYVEYLGYRLFRIKGAILGVVVFLLPSVILVTIISFLYCRFRTIPGIDHILRGIGPVVTAILFWAGLDMGKRMVGDYKADIILVIAFISQILKFDVLFTVLLCGLLGILIYRKEKVSVVAVSLPILIELFAIFLKIGSITFGGGYAAIPFIKSEIIDLRHWLTMREFVDGVAIAQITPGPVAILATFVGFKTQGIMGAGVATLGMFLPSF
ncbi:MAG: chromate transporter, partial [candidate division WOR-3 bacterium]